MKTLRAASILLVVVLVGGCPLFWPNHLTLTITPEGAGTVTLDPARGYYGDGETVTITAVPAGSYSLMHFVVDGAVAESMGDVLELVMNDDSSVKAVFTDQDFGVLVEPLDGPTEVTIDLGSAPGDVYMIFTNVGTSQQDVPAVTPLSGDFGSPPEEPRALPSSGPLRPPALRDHPVTQTPLLGLASRGGPPPPMPAIIGDESTGSLFDADSVLINVTRQASVMANGVELEVWVAIDSFGGGAGQVSQEMVDALAGKFLAIGDDNDIYEWVSGIFGIEWGPEPADAFSDYYIADNNTITIFLYDIDGDAADFQEYGGVVGFFWGKDNYTLAGAYNSNERVMFYMDAPMLAAVEPDEEGWAITNWWAEEVISTLAHEFQHMIQFYQKDVMRGGAGGAGWLNEMSSMVAEDLVADKLGVPGPRGVDYAAYPDGTAGAAGMGGWLETYNEANGTELTDWYYADPYPNYAVNYAFGAYLARNFGGAALFRNIVQNTDSGTDAIDTGLSLTGHAETFESALRNWAVANLLSDTAGQPVPHLYNAGGWIDATVDGLEYRLGSINLYNYGTGPYYQTSMVGDSVLAASSNYYKVSTGATGKLTWQVEAAPDVRLEIVVKR